MKHVARLDRLLDCLVQATMWLVLPLALLLFLQWPLRDLVQQGSREANDAAQCLFALFIAVAVTAATRSGTHLASDAFARRWSRSTRRRLLHGALLVGVLPWALFLLITATPQIVASVRQLEAFPETFNPGYFIIKIATGLLALCVLLQAVLELIGGATAKQREAASP